MSTTASSGVAPHQTSQILIWESTTRLEAGIKRELFAQPRWPSIRACRSAKAVAEKRDRNSNAVLVLDGSTLRKWFEQFDSCELQDVRSRHWSAVIAVVDTVNEPDWQWASCGITAILTGPINDEQIANACLRALSLN